MGRIYQPKLQDKIAVASKHYRDSLKTIFTTLNPIGVIQFLLKFQLSLLSAMFCAERFVTCEVVNQFAS